MIEYIVTSWCSIDEEPSKIVLGDGYGRLALLFIGNLKQLGLVLIPLGEVSDYILIF